VIVRYSDSPGEVVRVRSVGGDDDGERRYRCELVVEDRAAKYTEWRSLDAALRCGEEWLP
jgi:hypothetical protein